MRASQVRAQLTSPIPCPPPTLTVQVHAPLGVVAVCGRARQGKSYILNRLLKQTGKGFVVGPTHRPCTKVGWGLRGPLWSAPLTGPAPRALHLPALYQGKRWGVGREGRGFAQHTALHQGRQGRWVEGEFRERKAINQGVIVVAG